MSDATPSRRRFLRDASFASLGAAALAACASDAGGDAPAMHAERRVRWRLASSFTRANDVLFGAAERFAERVAQLTGDRFQIRLHPAGEVVPGFQVLDAVQNRTVEVGHTAGYYYLGKSQALAFETGAPFGMNVRQHEAWWYEGGGRDAVNSVLADFNVISFAGGNTGAQMGGWWRRELRSLADLGGLRIRIPGVGGRVMDRLGATALVMPGSELYQALERGTIDALEWVGPHDDEKMGFHRIARYYYYPGWWEPGGMLSFYVNRDAYEALPAFYREVIAVASADANAWMRLRYDALNPPALQRLVDGGAQLRRFPQDLVDAAREAANDLYATDAAADPAYRRVFESYTGFQRQTDPWFAVAEDSFMALGLRQTA